MKYGGLTRSFATPACACSGSGRQGHARDCPGHASGSPSPPPCMGQIPTPSCARLSLSSITGESVLSNCLVKLAPVQQLANFLAVPCLSAAVHAVYVMPAGHCLTVTAP